MKKLIIILLALSFTYSFNLLAQQNSNKTEKVWDYSNQDIHFTMKFAQNIKVTTWNNNQIMLKMIDTTENQRSMTNHIFNENATKDELTVEIDYKENAKNKTYYKKGDYYIYNGLRMDYEIFVPKNAKISIKSINGDIEILGLTGAVKAITTNGFVDVSCINQQQSNLNVHTINGEIYTNFEDLTLDKDSHAHSQKLTYLLNGGGKDFTLRSINGNIYLRKPE